MSAFIPSIKWCGVDHPHNPHRYAEASGSIIGFWYDCPGSACSHCHEPSASSGGVPEPTKEPKDAH